MFHEINRVLSFRYYYLRQPLTEFDKIALHATLGQVFTYIQITRRELESEPEHKRDSSLQEEMQLASLRVWLFSEMLSRESTFPVTHEGREKALEKFNASATVNSWALFGLGSAASLMAWGHDLTVSESMVGSGIAIAGAVAFATRVFFERVSKRIEALGDPLRLPEEILSVPSLFWTAYRAATKSVKLFSGRWSFWNPALDQAKAMADLNGKNSGNHSIEQFVNEIQRVASDISKAEMRRGHSARLLEFEVSLRDQLINLALEEQVRLGWVYNPASDRFINQNASTVISKCGLAFR